MGIETLREKAKRLKDSGLTIYEIASDMNIAEETVEWLLGREGEKRSTKDVKIGWRSVGVFPYRMGLAASIMADIILEEAESREFDVDTVVGIAINGIPYATLIAEELGLELSIFRPHMEKLGIFSSNYANVRDKNVVIVDDVIGSGKTMRKAIGATKNEGGKPVLCITLVNKRVQNDIDGVPLRALLRTRVI